ncbi:MAG: glutaredoxin family protein [Deltaproteobacteria bacterium]|nr:glutaredoxin family protein [Deltaproteobacteria bacterium]
MARQVRIFSTPKCPYCKLAKEYLDKKGIKYTEHDITADAAAREEMRELTGGAKRVPVIQVCDEVLVGFDKKKVESALACMEQSSEV